FQPTVIHIGTFSFFLNLWPALALSRAPILYRAGDHPGDHTVFHRLAWRYAVYPLTTMMVAVSEFVATAHRRLGLDGRKLTVIPNAMPTDAPRPAPRADAPPCLLFVGQMAPHKGVHHLVEAALRLGLRFPELEVDIVGPSDTPYAQQLMRSVADAGMAERIRFHGYQADPAPFYAQATVHVAPSQCNEAFGLVVLEAKAAAVPSVVFRDGALPDMVRHGRNGWVCAEPTSAALETALERYLRDPALAREHGVAAQRSIAELGVDRAAYDYAVALERLHCAR
ncbi:MAG: glycosyltransferase family 4 protein, partial [Nevskiaceae bacterium]